MLPQHSQKSFWLYKFSSKHVSIWCQKKHLHWPISWRPRTAFLKHFEIKCLYISVRKCLFQRRSKILYGWGWVGGRLNNFLKAAHCLCLIKYFTIFHFNWNFWKFWLFLSISILPSIALKRWELPDNLDFQEKTVAKFLNF